MDIITYVTSMIEISKLKKKIKNYDVSYDSDKSKFDWIEDGDVKKSFIIAGGSNPNGTSISVRTDNSSVAEVYGSKIILQFSFISTYSDGTPTGDGTMSVSVDGIKYIINQPVAQGSDCTVDVTEHLTIGNHTVTIEVSDAKGNTDSVRIAVQVISLTMASSYSQTTVNNKTLQFPYVVSGTGEKTIYAFLDDDLLHTEVISTTGRQSYLEVPTQKHGAHKLLMYAETEVNGKTIRSNELYYELIFIEVNNVTPIIVSNFNKKTSDQYNTLSIPYIVYDPSSLTTNVKLLVNGAVVSTLNGIDRTMHTWNYRSNLYGEVEFKIVCGSVEKVFYVDIQKLTIEAGRVSGAELYFVASDGDNNSEERDKWTYKDDAGVVTAMKFSDNFDWDNGGFQTDDDGDPMFRIKSGTSITIPKKLFAQNSKTTGKTIKFIFRASNVRNYESNILTCLSLGKGLRIGAQTATLTSEQSNLLVQYCEDRYIELDIVIGKVDDRRYLIPYLSGIPAKVELYPEDDNFAQITPVDITIGSDDCDVDFYMFSSYNFALSPKEILANFIADAKNSNEMIDRHARNNIYDDNGKIDYDKLPTTMRYTIISSERFTTSKKDPVPCDIIHVDKSDSSRSFTASNASFKVQGTSSAAYGEAGFNLDIDFSKSGFIMSDTGAHEDNFALSDKSIPCNYFCWKVNIASSENANNVCLTDDYENYNPYLYPPKELDSRARGTIEGIQDVLFWHNTTTNETIFYGMANMNNSKKNLEVFGQDRTKHPQQACVEFLNNTSLRCLWKTGDFDGWEDDFEFRFPDSPTEQDVANFQRVVAWVASTDRTAATDRTLTSAELTAMQSWKNPTCNETKDNIAYRSAKFTNELEDYFIKSSVLYYYVFTERHSMVDNRAKNAFPQTEDGIHWHFCIMYDCDTGDGNNNEGDLILDYGYEDTDTIGSKDVFNGAKSALWCNVRDLMFKELGEMFRDRENAGAWDSERITKKYEDFQAAWPEAIWIEDHQKKYLNPYETTGTTAYLPMAYGKKSDQRYWWEHYMEIYMSSKYQGNKCIANAATLRCYTPNNWAGVAPNGDITITPYSDLYVTIKYASYIVTKRTKRGVATKMVCPLDAGMNDTEVYIYCASYISDIGDLAPLYVGYVNIAPMEKLQTLLVGSSVSGYSNSNMQNLGIGRNRLLRYIQLENLPKLAQTVDASSCDTLETFKAYGSAIAGAIFSVGGRLKFVEMQKPSIINVRNQKYLQTFAVKDYSALSTVRIEYSPYLDTLTILERAGALNRVRVLGIDWQLEDTTSLDRLTEFGGIDENGNNTQYPVLKGNVFINKDLYRSDVIYYEDTFSALIVDCLNIIEDLLMDKDGNAITDLDRYFIGVSDGPHTSEFSYEVINKMIAELEG